MTKLKGPRRGVHYDLFMMLDIYSRYCPGWMVVDQEDGQVAKAWIAEVVASQHIEPGTLTIHADRGSSMTSKPVAVLLADLKIGRTHSRPHVSNDNPYSEAGFKTLKYCPIFPGRFGSRQDAILFCEAVFPLLQPGAPPLRYRAAHTGLGPLRAAPKPCKSNGRSSSTPPTRPTPSGS